MRDASNPDKTAALAELLAGQSPTLVSAHAFERDGVNVIPEIFADQLGRALGWPVDANVVQANVVSHTSAP